MKNIKTYTQSLFPGDGVYIRDNKYRDMKRHVMLFENYAEGERKQNIVKQLLDAGADPNMADDRGVRPLDIDGEGLINAVRMRKPSLVQRLLDAGADPDVVSNHGFTPLYFAVSSISPDLVRLLLQRGADPFKTVPTNRGDMSPQKLAVDLLQGGRLSVRDAQKMEQILDMFDRA